jgi:dihydrofolate synthase/folylpolyglutamate synthase
VERPLLSIITNVSLEHTQYLGKSPAEIAARKSGIIKKNRPVITAAAQEEVLQVIRGKAEEQESALFEVYREMTWQLIEETPDGQYFAVCGPGYDYGKLFLPLRGDHQLANAATALLALEVLMRLGWIIPLEDVRRGLACTFWPGRLEKVSRAPLIVLDGAHNPAGMQVLAAWLKKQRPRYRRVILLIGMLADKDRISSVQFLNNLADSIIITRPPSVRADHWEELAGYFDQPGQEIVQIEGWQEALKRAREQLGPEDLLLITGSLYLIGAVRASLLSSG